MTKTLIEITQGILQDINGDEVNSITDTEESEQVARHVINTFNAMMSSSTWPLTRTNLKLVARSDLDFPTHLKLPANMKELVVLNYDINTDPSGSKNYKEINYEEPDAFLRKTNLRDSNASNVKVVLDDSGIELFIYNDQAPKWFTSFNDTDIILDSYDSSVDDTIKASKTQAIGYLQPELAFEDDAVPLLPPDALSSLIEQATTRAQWKIKEVQDIISERESTRQRRYMSRKSWRTHKEKIYPDYGRGRGKILRDPTFTKSKY